MELPEQTKPGEGWHKSPLEDWRLIDDRGELIGSVVHQTLNGKRLWYSVSERLRHGPNEGSLTECKRRIEKLWRTRMEA